MGRRRVGIAADPGPPPFPELGGVGPAVQVQSGGSSSPNGHCHMFPHFLLSAEEVLQIPLLLLPLLRVGPEALGSGSSLAVWEGQSLRLACVVHSHPPARLSWVRGSQNLKSLSSASPGGAGGAWEHPQSLELELPGVRLEDHGELVCGAQNPLGAREASLRLSVEDAPQNLTIGVIGKEGSAGHWPLGRPRQSWAALSTGWTPVSTTDSAESRTRAPRQPPGLGAARCMAPRPPPGARSWSLPAQDAHLRQPPPRDVSYSLK
ncbi:PREDICTED: sialic acid-binding Ig-like lectin 8 [Condylura cristata]|uniref:sialic acid-binding Ig-like lectin 8 n=1 Tax=Condylura cristata TaxID=143302 RepID=UPI000642900D|nr:PREDICTED: sialic acid-binding Ig-like lectin 8 [Condylura cristata]